MKNRTETISQLKAYAIAEGIDYPVVAYLLFAPFPPYVHSLLTFASQGDPPLSDAKPGCCAIPDSQCNFRRDCCNYGTGKFSASLKMRASRSQEMRGLARGLLGGGRGFQSLDGKLRAVRVGGGPLAGLLQLVRGRRLVSLRQLHPHA